MSVVLLPGSSTVEYVGKSEETALIGYSWLNSNYMVNADTIKADFYTEKRLLEIIADCTNDNEYVRQVLLEYLSGLLSFDFQPVSIGRENTIRYYHFQIKNSEGVKAYRRGCWNVLMRNLQKDQGKQILPFMKRYARTLSAVEDWDIVSDDKPYVDHLLTELPCSVIQKAQIFRNLHYAWREHGDDSYSSNELFQLDEWKLFCILENRYYQTDISYEEYEVQRAERLSEYAGSLSEDQMAVFIELADRLVADVESAERFCLNEGVSQIVNKVCIDRSKALKIFLLLMKNGHHLEVVPAKMLQTLFDFTLPIEIWRVIQEYSFPQKNTWEYWFFQMLPENKINEELYSLMIEYLEEDTDKLLKSSPYRNMRFLDKFTTIHSEVYVSAARIIFRKREYSSFIVSIYFSLLFHENTYTPQELKRFFETDLELLRDIYMWMASYDSTFDYKGSFLAEYITIDDSWINAYATICSDIIMNDCDRDHHQINVLWHSKDYLNYMDVIFNKVAENTGYFSSWRVANAFASILSLDKNMDETYRRKKEWLMHAVQVLAHDDKIVILFAAITKISTDLRKEAFEVFLSCNDDYEWFVKLPLDPDYWGGMEGTIIPDLQSRIDFLNSLLPLVSGINFLKHSKQIKERMEMWKSQIKSEERDALIRHLYA